MLDWPLLLDVSDKDEDEDEDEGEEKGAEDVRGFDWAGKETSRRS